MPEPTIRGGTGNGRTVQVIDGKDPGDVLTAYGVQNLVTFRDKSGVNRHIVYSTGTLGWDDVKDGGTYNGLEIGSFLVHTTSGAAAVYFKALASGNAAFVKMSTEAHGFSE
jgi:hypothetical protein